MPRNVEIKAVVDNLDELSRRVDAVCGEAAAELLVQEDTFFHAPKGGRLKLREFRKAELIFYDRADVEGAKLSDYVKTEEALSRAIGISGIVRKTRTVFIYKGQTRVHLDRVDGLGDFLEFEVCLTDDQTVQEGQQIADDLLHLLNVRKCALVKGAYFDHLTKCPHTRP
uniref:CYTH domain-containing protein n=1 Tax=Globodera rostochiensis TaxID=31243 RepID=A0A914IBT3_GLORO